MSATMTSAPERSLEQRREALRKANRIRSARAELKRNAKARRASVTDVLLAPAPEMETMKVLELLLAAPKVGRAKATKMLKLAEASPSKTVSGLSERQRRSLTGMLRRIDA